MSNTATAVKQVKHWNGPVTRYADWSPSQHDPKGLGLDDRQDWIVCPHLRTRDSGILESANWKTQLAIIDKAGIEYEVHRFGHWGPGWFEIVLLHPGTDTAVLADLDTSDYPILCEETHSRHEHEAQCEAWKDDSAFGLRAKVMARMESALGRKFTYKEKRRLTVGRMQWAESEYGHGIEVDDNGDCEPMHVAVDEARLQLVLARPPKGW